MAIVKKISELTPKGANLATTDLLIVGVDNGTDYDLKSVTGAQLLGNATSGLVPYTGATTNLNLGEFEVKAGQISLDTTPTGTATVGTTRWNDALGISETTLKGGSVVIKNGVDLVARVVNKVTPTTTLTKANYQVVRISGAQGQRLAVNLAQANNDNNSADTLGIVCETIATNAEGFIMTMGQLENVNTTGSLQSETWVDGDVLYLSPTTAGKITNIKPTGETGHIVILGYVEYAHAVNGKIYVKVMNGWELDELHNVSISNPLDKQILSYENSTSLWKNKTVTTADISDSSNKRYVTDANLTTIGNTSGVNTGDETVSTIKTKLGITTLSGSNTGDETNASITTLVNNATASGAPADTDKLPITNIGGTMKSLSWSLLKSTLNALFLSSADTFYMKMSNNLSDLTNTTTARTNLGLGTLATQSGTFSGTSSGTNTGDQIISDATISLTDITTNNVSSTKHGFAPKTPNNTTTFLRGDGTWATPSSGGLTYFTEAQSTASPNATVNVDSLTAVASTTNADFAICPKGSGAILVNTPDNAVSGGNKRGQYSVDLQMYRDNANQVASGYQSVISGGWNNRASGDQSVSVGGYRNHATNTQSSALGGYQNTASGVYAVTVGGSTNTAFGNLSFACGNSNTSNGAGSVTFGGSNIANGTWSFAFGNANQVNGLYSQIRGLYGNDFGVYGRFIYSMNNTTLGDSQSSKLILNKRTTDDVATVLSVQGVAVSATSQLVLSNNSVYRVKGSITGKQSASTNVGVWDIDCVIVRGASAATTIIAGTPTVSLVVNTGSFGAPTLTANTTLGCLTVTVIGATSTNIQWTCVIDTTEVIYA